MKPMAIRYCNTRRMTVKIINKLAEVNMVLHNKSDNLKVLLVAVAITIILSARKLMEISTDWKISSENRINGSSERNPVDSTVAEGFPEIFLEPHRPCRRDDSVIVYVLSTINGRARRDVIRSTWGHVELWNKNVFNPFQLELFFVIGTTCNSNETWSRDLERLEIENNLHGDLLVGDVTDCYTNLTNKGIIALKWIKNSCSDDDISLSFSKRTMMFL